MRTKGFVITSVRLLENCHFSNSSWFSEFTVPKDSNIQRVSIYTSQIIVNQQKSNQIAIYEVDISWFEIHEQFMTNYQSKFEN